MATKTDALLAGDASITEIDEALELRVEQLLGSVLLDADDLFDAGDADAGQGEGEAGNAGLDVLNGDLSTRIFVHIGKGSRPIVHTDAQKTSPTPQGFPKAYCDFRATKAVDGTGQPPAEHRLRTLLPSPQRSKPRSGISFHPDIEAGTPRMA